MNIQNKINQKQLGALAKLKIPNDSEREQRLEIVRRLHNRDKVCQHFNTVGVSSDVPDYYDCVNCGYQLSESEIIDIKDQQQAWYADILEAEATGN